MCFSTAQRLQIRTISAAISIHSAVHALYLATPSGLRKVNPAILKTRSTALRIVARLYAVIQPLDV
ncbi:MAG: hypothetical protein ABIF19_17150 [Planctomycetota bacterium]